MCAACFPNLMTLPFCSLGWGDCGLLCWVLTAPDLMWLFSICYLLLILLFLLARFLINSHTTNWKHIYRRPQLFTKQSIPASQQLGTELVPLRSSSPACKRSDSQLGVSLLTSETANEKLPSFSQLLILVQHTLRALLECFARLPPIYCKTNWQNNQEICLGPILANAGAASFSTPTFR